MKQRLGGQASGFTHIICCILILFSLTTPPAFSVEINQLNLIPAYRLDDSGYSAAMALHPRDGSLHVAWVTRFGDIKYAVKNFNGSWSVPDRVPDGGNAVFGMEHSHYRPCLDLTIDSRGVSHMVFGTESGGLWYVKGHPNVWQAPEHLVEKRRYTIYAGIESVEDHLYVIYEDSTPDDEESFIYTLFFNGTAWSLPERVAFGEYAKIVRGGDDRVYAMFRGQGPAGKTGKDIWFGSLKYGDDTWRWQREIVDYSRDVGQGPDLCVHDNSIYIAWPDLMEEDDPQYIEYVHSTRLLLAVGKEPGSDWVARVGFDPRKMLDNTHSPHPRVAAYSDGAVIFMNGARTERLWLWKDAQWSGERDAPWHDGDRMKGGYAEVISDGKTVWVAHSTGGPGRLEIHGIENPKAEHFNPPAPDAVDDLEIIATEILGKDGYGGDLCTDPLTGTLWATWVSMGNIYQKYQPLKGSWSEVSRVPTGDLNAHGHEDGWLRPCLAMTVDLQGRRHLAFGDDQGRVYHIMHDGDGWNVPVWIASTGSSAIHLRIAAGFSTVTVVYEDAADNTIHSAWALMNTWQPAVKVCDGEYPDLAFAGEGRLYVCSISMDNNRSVQLSHCIPGFTDWRTQAIVTPAHRTGGGPALATFERNLYLAYNHDTGSEFSDYKSELFVAMSPDGAAWDAQYGGYGPVYYENTSDPHPRVAVYSDGQILLLNGSRRQGRFAIYNGNLWSKTRTGNWPEGIGRIACDGRVVSHIISTTGKTHADVTVTAIRNPDAGRFDYTEHAPFFAWPETLYFANVNQAFTMPLPETDNAGRSLAWSVSSLAPLRSGMQLRTAPHRFSWTPDNADLSADPRLAGAGRHLVGLHARTPSGRVSTLYFWIQVLKGNTPPVITTTPVTEIQALNAYRLNVDANDADLDPLSFSLLDYPPGMEINAATGIMQWTPTAADTGDHPISIKVSDDRGGSDTLQYTLTVHPVAAPIAAFGTQQIEGTAPFSVQFFDSSQGLIDTRLWNFGDAQTSEAQHPVHVYAAPGSYTVQLTVTGPGGSDSERKTDLITVLHAPPVASFGANVTRGPVPLVVQFTDSSHGEITRYSWDFGKGASDTTQHPSTIFETPGWYPVSLCVTGPGGSDTLKRDRYIEAYAPSPIAQLDADIRTGVTPLTVQFQDISLGEIALWSWKFGDGATSSERHPQHTYTETGTHRVSLFVSGPGGQDSVWIENMITVLHAPPVARFIADTTQGAVPFNVQFTDASDGYIDTWNWNFGDGGTSALQNPAHRYDQSGFYAVALMVTGPGGSDTLRIENLIQVNLTGITAGPEYPEVFRLLPNYPNPFNPVTAIRYQLAAAAQVKLQVFDVSGHPVRMLVDDGREAGFYQHLFDGTGLASGVYFCRIVIVHEHGMITRMQKMTLLK